MGIIKKPSEIEPKATISILIYGQPGLGKTTLGCSAPSPVLFDYDGGVQRVNAAHQVPTVQIRSWEDTITALSEIRDEEAAGNLVCRTIVIDTVGKMLDFMSDYIIRTNPKMAMGNGALSLKGYGERKKMFSDFIKAVIISGKSVVFIAHEREEKQGEETKKRPEIGGSSAGDLIKELDLMGYMSAYGKDRTISFNPTDAYYAKNTCNLPETEKLKVTVDKDGNAVGKNDYISTVISRYVAFQKEQQTKKLDYQQQVDEFSQLIDDASDCEALNAVYEKFAELEYIFNSRLVIGQKLEAKAKQLKCKFNKSSKRYE